MLAKKPKSGIRPALRRATEKKLPEPSGRTKERIDQHCLWLSSYGTEGERVNAETADDFLVFRGLNLAGVNLSMADLTGADFRGSNLEAARFIGCELAGASFEGANLRNADFEGVGSLAFARFDGADLEGASFEDVHVKGAMWDHGDVEAFRRALRSRAEEPGCPEPS